MSEWFDIETGVLNFDEAVAKNTHFQKIMEDGVVSEEEVAGQAKYVLSLLKTLYESLDDRDRDLVRQVIEELTVLSVVSQHQAIQVHK